MCSKIILGEFKSGLVESYYTTSSISLILRIITMKIIITIITIYIYIYIYKIYIALPVICQITL